MHAVEASNIFVFHIKKSECNSCRSWANPVEDLIKKNYPKINKMFKSRRGGVLHVIWSKIHVLYVFIVVWAKFYCQRKDSDLLFFLLSKLFVQNHVRLDLTNKQVKIFKLFYHVFPRKILTTLKLVQRFSSELQCFNL